jgi:hypothetical protein
MFRDLDDLKLFVSYMQEHLHKYPSLEIAMQAWINFKQTLKCVKK